MVAVRTRPSTAVRLLLATVLAVACLLVPAALSPTTAPAGAQDDTSTTEAPESPGIIPEPNSGSEPEDAGDRGGGLQTLVFVIVVAGVGVMGWLIVRESRKAREKRGF